MSFDSAVITRLREWAREERSKAVEQLVYGALKPKMYRYTTGYIKGLDDCITITDQIISDIQGE